MPAARLVTREMPRTSMPDVRAAIASSAVDMPTRSPPIAWPSAPRPASRSAARGTGRRRPRRRVGSTSRASARSRGGVQVGEVDERRALQRGRGGEVDVVADEHRRARRPRRVEPAAAVGQHDGRQPAAAAVRTAVHHGADAPALVEVGPRPVDQRALPGVTDGDRPHAPAVSRRPPRRGSRARRRCRSVARVGPMRSAVSPQPEPRTSATSWVGAPVRSAMTVAAALATSKGSVPGSLRSTLTHAP